MSTAEDVLDHHLAAFGAQDIENTIADYADDAVLITQGETYRGREELSTLFEGLFAEFSQSDVTFSLEEKTVEDEYAYIVWQAETPDNDYEFATDTFVIREGNIVAQTLATIVTPKS